MSYSWGDYIFFQASEELEDRESLAVMAASGLDGDEDATGDGETFIEKYTRGVSAVETILTLDKLRQSVAVRELLNEKIRSVAGAAAAGGQGGVPANGAAGNQFMRKTVSVPNFSQVI